MIWEVFNDIMTNALEQWDYSSVFAPGYAGITEPIFVPARMWQIESQIETLTNGNGQFTQVLISLESLPGHDSGTKTFADIYGPGQLPNTTYRLGSRIRYPFDVTTWVDQQLGGMTMARKLAGQVTAAMFFYRNRLTTIRHINLFHWQEVFGDQSQLFSVRMTFEGDVHMTVDV
jgi:hypothetical protein